MSDKPTMYPIDVASVRSATKEKWIKAQKRKVSFLEKIELSVPFWIVIITIALLLLSGPHTMSTFDKITPGFGWVAPFLVEFGLLYTAFSRRKMRQRAPEQKNKTINWTLIILEVLLFLTAIIVNGAGTFNGVISATNLKDRSFNEIMTGFAILDASNQVALLLIPVVAFIIPIGTLVGGDGFALLIIERQTSTGDLEDQWRTVAPLFLYTAFHDALVEAGNSPGMSRKYASQYAEHKPDHSGSQRTKTDKPPLNRGEGMQRLEELFRVRPSCVYDPVPQLMDATGVGRTAVYEWLAKKRSLNGNGHNASAPVEVVNNGTQHEV